MSAPANAISMPPSSPGDELLAQRRRRIASLWGALAGVGGLLAAASAGLPWVALRAGDINVVRTGIDTGGDGFITGGLGLLVVALAAWGWRRPDGPPRRVGTIALIAGFVIMSIPALDWTDFRRAMFAIDETIAALTTPEIGLYGTAVGGLLSILGGWQLRRALRLGEQPKARGYRAS